MINNVINLGFFVFKFTIKYIYFNEITKIYKRILNDKMAARFNVAT